MAYTVGSVPYLNAKPLVKPFEWQGEASPVKVLYDVPARLPELLTLGEAKAIMVSSYFAVTRPGCRVADGLSISTQREVLSVRLFSKVAPADTRSIAFDQGSMTSNAVAMIVLRERYQADPEGDPEPPSLAGMLAEHDACVMIGDNGMRADATGLNVLDLGAEWFALTGLPFVWAVWAGAEELDAPLVDHLQAALAESRESMPRVIEEAATETGFSREECERYLTEIMDYRLGTEHLEGLAEFARRIETHRLAERTWMPEVVSTQPLTHA